MENEIVQTESALESIERAQVDMQIATAKKYPRSIVKAREKVLELATCDPKVAESCFYIIPRDGKVIEGPTIRLAEIVAASYGNIKCAARVIQEKEKSIVCQGVCIDLENNVSSSVEAIRSITTKHGKRYSEKMIGTTMNAGCSIAFRNAVFKTVPSAIFKDVFQKIKQVSIGDERTIRERRKAALAWFKSKGVKEREVFSMLANSTDCQVKGAEDITIEHLQILNGVKTAISDGEITAKEAFSESEASPKTDPLTAGTTKMRAKPEPTKQKEKRGRPKKEADPVQKVEATTVEPEQDVDQELQEAYDNMREKYLEDGTDDMIDAALEAQGLPALSDIQVAELGEKQGQFLAAYSEVSSNF